MKDFLPHRPQQPTCTRASQAAQTWCIAAPGTGSGTGHCRDNIHTHTQAGRQQQEQQGHRQQTRRDEKRAAAQVVLSRPKTQVQGHTQLVPEGLPGARVPTVAAVHVEELSLLLCVLPISVQTPGTTAPPSPSPTPPRLYVNR